MIEHPRPARVAAAGPGAPVAAARVARLRDGPRGARQARRAFLDSRAFLDVRARLLLDTASTLPRHLLAVHKASSRTGSLSPSALNPPRLQHEGGPPRRKEEEGWQGWAAGGGSLHRRRPLGRHPLHQAARLLPARPLGPAQADHARHVQAPRLPLPHPLRRPRLARPPRRSQANRAQRGAPLDVPSPMGQQLMHEHPPP